LRIFENRALRRIFVPKREEVVGGWRRLHNREFHNLHVSPNIVRMIKSRRMQWAEQVACIGEMRNLCKILVGKPEGDWPVEVLGVEEKMDWIIGT
jgi:hypothetical protein